MGHEKQILEFENLTYYVKGSKIDIIDRFESVIGDKLFICNFQGAVTRVMTIDAPVKYAESMVIRKLQEEGEFDEPVTILTHLKRKRGSKSTEIFFTAVKSKLYLQYQDRIEDHDDLVILFPLYTILFNFLKKVSSKDPCAVVFRHGRFADILVGTKKRVLFASRCTGFDESQEQISSLWNMVEQDISQVEKDNLIKIEKIICLNWVDTCTDKAIQELSSKYYAFNEEQISFQDTICDISFLKAVRMVPARMGITKKTGWLLYYSRQFAHIAAFLLLLFSFGFIAFYFSYANKTDVIEQDIVKVEEQISKMNKQIALKPLNKEFSSVFSFVNDLHLYKNTPSFKTIIHDMDTAVFEPLILENLKINYTGKNVTTEIYGVIHSDFDSAYKGYQILLKTLEKKGYIITENSFNTRIDQSEFKLIFSGSLL